MAIRSDASPVTCEAASPSPSDVVGRRHRMRARFAVHLGLLALFAASLATVTLTTEG